MALNEVSILTGTAHDKLMINDFKDSKLQGGFIPPET
jgi:hypothetical protein